MSAIYEEDFLPCSHGYRQGKSPQRAAIELSEDFQRGRYGWVVDADIKGFFDNIDHEWLMKMLELRINDKRFLELIRKWLNRRSQRKSCNWEGFEEKVKYFKLPYPRITGYWK